MSVNRRLICHFWRVDFFALGNFTNVSIGIGQNLGIVSSPLESAFSLTFGLYILGYLFEAFSWTSLWNILSRGFSRVGFTSIKATPNFTVHLMRTVEVYIIYQRQCRHTRVPERTLIRSVWPLLRTHLPPRYYGAHSPPNNSKKYFILSSFLCTIGGSSQWILSV